MLSPINNGQYFILRFQRVIKTKHFRKVSGTKNLFFVESIIKMSQNNEKLSIEETSGASSHVSKNPIKYLPSPTKSQNDKKEYRVICLENKLTALLISDILEESHDDVEDSEKEYSSEEEGSGYGSSDNEAGENMDDDEESGIHFPIREEKLAALGLCVNVGSYSDPWEIQGIAHFLEHMVFMGSEKFPKENDFDAFIKKRGGSDNAETDCETTTFYFECQDRHLKEAIDKFSQFFISPLMKREAMTREREAVESEFQMGITSDDNRRDQLLCSLAQPDSPTRKFTWGNLKTLRDNVSDDDLYTTVHEFRKRHYSAHRMTLAVQARLPIETLESWILECFSAVPNNNLPADNFSKFAGLAFNTSEFKKMYWVKSVNDVCEVELTWALPPLQHMYRSKPSGYVEELIGHEGKGSILSYLRKEVWALAISAGCEMDGSSNNSMYTLFVINIVLTEEGFLNLREVLNAVFGYIKMLQNTGPSESFFHELQTIQETKFEFAEEVPPDENVETLATYMHFYPPEDYISGPELFFEYNPEAIKKVLSALTPDDVNIMVSCKNPEKVLEKIEPWFQTEYAVTDIPNDWRETWRNAQPDEFFRMPDPNIFLTSNFDILPISEEDRNILYPVKVHHNELSEVWYRRDVTFKLPQAYISFYLISPVSLSTSKDATAMGLYVQILKQMLVEDLYPALVADLSCSINSSGKGIVLKFDGYNEKLHLLLEAVINCMKGFNSYLTPDLFVALKDVQTRYYYNTFLKPGKLNKDLRLSLVLQTYWNAVDKCASLADITLSTMREFAEDFIKHLYVKSLFQGNLTKTAAVDACNRVVEILKFAPLLPNTHPEIQVLEVPLGEHYCCVKSFNTEDTNSVVTNYYQSGLFDITDYCIVELIMMLMEEPVFDVLRTKEQLGYHVYSSLRYTYGIVGFSVTVNCQAVKHSVDHVDNRIEAFLQKFSKILQKTKEKELAEVRSSLIKLKTLSDIHLKEEVNRNWEEITSSEYMFDRHKKEVACLEGIKMPEIRKWFANHVQHGSKDNFRKLSVQVVGTAQTNKIQQQEKSLNFMNKVRRHSKERQYQLQSELQNSIPVSDSSEEYSLQFITGDDTKTNHPRKIINSIEDFKNGLNVYPIIKVKY